ncbi:MAG: hypothetical protein GXO92_08845 [FCB group bacterium]|nr:hypothetical protein [FCB group bacterium]
MNHIAYKIVTNIKLLAILLLFLSINIGCNKSTECSNCGGGLTGGYLYKRVTQEDLAQLGGIEGITLETCIRYKFLTEDEFDLESIDIVDNCCCDQYEF